VEIRNAAEVEEYREVEAWCVKEYSGVSVADLILYETSLDAKKTKW
jgi:hypothetical protein